MPIRLIVLAPDHRAARAWIEERLQVAYADPRILVLTHPGDTHRADGLPRATTWVQFGMVNNTLASEIKERYGDPAEPDTARRRLAMHILQGGTHGDRRVRFPVTSSGPSQGPSGEAA